MSAYRLTETKLHLPVSQPVPDAAIPGECVAVDGVRVLTCWGELHRVRAELEATPLGTGGREYARWRGQLPDGVEPEPGWTLEAKGARYRVLAVGSGLGQPWCLDVERVE